MFDGNHRIRRSVNLGGGGGGGGPRGTGGRRSRRPTTTTTTGSSASSSARLTSAAGGAASGVPDRKAHLLETARIQREQRRGVARRNGAARNLQRSFRGWSRRRGVAEELRGRYGGGLSLSLSSSSAAAAAVGEELLGSGGRGGVAELASVLGALLSPPLLPFLDGGDGGSPTTTTSSKKKKKKKKPQPSSSSSSSSNQAAILALLLPFRSVVDKLLVSENDNEKSPASSPRRRQLRLVASDGANKEEGGAARARAREAFVRGRIVRRALDVLRGLPPGGNAAASETKQPAAAAAAAAAAAGVGVGVGADDASRLAGLVALLLGSNLDGTAATDADGNSNDDSGNSIVLANVLRNASTAQREGYGPVLLFLCFRDWFWAATSSPSNGEVVDVAGTLLRLSAGAASSLSPAQGITTDTTAARGEDDDDARSILAAALFASRRPAPGGKADLWSEELDRCVGRGGGGGGAGGAGGRGNGYVALMASLVRTLQSSSSDSDGEDKKKDGGPSVVVQDAVRSMISGREEVLLTNALDRLAPSISGSSSGDSTLSDEASSCAVLIVQVLRYVLTRRTDLAVISSLVARGEDVRPFLLVDSGRDGGAVGGSNGGIADVVDLTNGDDGAGDDDDDDDESSSDTDTDEMMMDEAGSSSGGGGGPTSGPQQQGGTAGAVGAVGGQRRFNRSRQSSRQTRSDIQTVPKLGRLYQAEVSNARREALTRLRTAAAAAESASASTRSTRSTDEIEMLVNLAERIGSGTLMSALGVSIFVPTSASPSTATTATAKLVYASILSDLLQSTTSSKNSASSPLLSKLAFNPNFLEELWDYVVSLPLDASRGNISLDAASDSIAATVAFCDVFGHHLMAVDDEEFLASYAHAGSTGNGGQQRQIVAEDVVSHIRNVLHELFWTKPVLSRDVSVPSRCSRDDAREGGGRDPEAALRCHRARLLLSATKLWNSLYERWCRLCRSAPFCDERVWWFPRLVTRERDDDGAVMVGGVSAAMHGNGDDDDDDDDDEMDDSDSAASPMDVDGASLDGGGGVASNAVQQPTAAEEENDALASSFSDPKMARVLTIIPQALPFDRRVNLFNSLLMADKARTQDETRAFRQAMRVHMRRRGGDMDSDEEWEFTGREQAEIRRDRLYEDSMDQLNKLGRKLRRRVQVTLINKHGAAEAGIDGGGVFKEFLDDLIKEAFDPRGETGRETSNGGGSNSLFIVTPTQTLTVNVDAQQDRDILSHYEFLGRVLGKALYESILVEPQFCLPFLNSLLGKQNTLDDLKNLDPEYYRHLNGLRKMSEAEIDGLGLTFELTGGGHRQQTVELIPGGSTLQVTKQNAIRYVHLVAHRKLNVESARQTHAFLRGFRDLVPAAWVRLFSAHELQKLISGDDTVKGIDVTGFRKFMQYSGGYHPSQPIIRWLWEVLEEMTPTQQRSFLKFMTSCSRQPLLGFQALVPLPCVQQIRLQADEVGGGGDVRLPTSSTCMNLLKLPNYKSKEMLREKLLYAIEAGAGFELS